MAIDKDSEQDALIRQNAEHIRLNEAAIRRQTEALEKIRDHYFPQKGLWKKSCELFLKAVGAVTVAAGLLEAADWCWNTRQAESMAAESAAVAKRLFQNENDVPGAVKFLEKAVELDSSSLKYRTALAYVKGFAAIADLFDLGRPLTDAERMRVDEILADAVYLQEIAPDEPMSYVLAAQAQMLRGESAASIESAERAIAVASDNVQAYVTSCAMHFASGDVAGARKRLSEAERLNPEFPLVLFWKGFLALVVDHDAKTALGWADRLIQSSPQQVQAHVLRGRALLALGKDDSARAREAFERALALDPKNARVMVFVAETYSREGQALLSRLWLDRALEKDPDCMAALVSRGSLEDLTRALSLAPFRADLYRLRAAARKAAGVPGEDQDSKIAVALERK